MTPTGIIELLKLTLRVWLAVNLTKPFRRINEINTEITNLSIGANESTLVQIENLNRERRILTKLISTIHPD